MKSKSLTPAAFGPSSASDYLLRQGILKLLVVKDSDIRLLTLEQVRTAVDKGLHSGGASSATIPLVTLFYGGFIDLDIAAPTKAGQDIFTLSKGHAVAALASIYAELGYFDQAHLKNSRSYSSILNGHPGPLLPGVHVATGPMGQGLGVAQGFAIAGRRAPRFDSYCMVGDGELQEGPIWEAVMFAATKHLDNMCVLVDRNNGQLDIASRMVFPMPDLGPVFSSYGWRVLEVDATQYDGVFDALDQFRYGPRNGKPTAIICHSTKGHGSLSDFMNKHKVTVPDTLLEQELALQVAQRDARVEDFARFYARLVDVPGGDVTQGELDRTAERMHLRVERSATDGVRLRQVVGPVLTQCAPPRDKGIRYVAAALPRLDSAKSYAASHVVTEAMKVFAVDRRVVSIDSDLATTSGLEAGVAAVDQQRALNVGVAEANMMLIGEAFAALGHNTWISTFCPFFDWKVMRRVAVGQQEREEVMATAGGWLSAGHGLDLTMLATAANFETRTNGATHMGNDDSLVFDAIAHLKIVDVSCPRQMLGLMLWIMEGNRGLVYARVMRTESAVLYGEDFVFEYGRGYVLREAVNDTAVIVSGGRGVHEALAAAARCRDLGISVGVIDMPSVDEALFLRLHDSGKTVFVVEQNNGYLWQNFLKVLHRNARGPVDLTRIVAINTLGGDGRPRFIHSGTYEELLDAFGMNPPQIAKTICARIGRAQVGAHA